MCIMYKCANFVLYYYEKTIWNNFQAYNPGIIAQRSSISQSSMFIFNNRVTHTVLHYPNVAVTRIAQWKIG